MRLTDFLRDRGMLLLLHLVSMCLAAAFFRLTGYSGTNTILFLTVWMLLLTVWLLITFLQRRRFFREARRILDKVDQRYLLSELLPDSVRLEDRLYREMLHRSNKSCIERIRQIEEDQRDYKEYIESWVHEIKAPITGIALLCNNRRGFAPSDTIPQTLEASKSTSSGSMYTEAESSIPLSRKWMSREKAADETAPASRADYLTISLENQKIENYVDMVLYYARSEEVYRDYLIRETSLEDVACEVLDKNHLLLIRNRVRADINCRDTVYTDRKWIAFILNQMLLNSVKYRGENPLLRISTRRERDGVLLIFEDNGIGIRQEELSRIFDKGFTGSNGRDNGRSTGMGLYLCKKLCDRLGIGLSAESECGVGTKLYLEFPISNYILLTNDQFNCLTKS